MPEMRLASLEARYRRVARLLFSMMVFILVAVTVGFIGIRSVTNKIQQERYYSLVLSCNQSADRNDAALRELNTRLDEAKADATREQAVQIEQSRAFSTALIGRLVPKRPSCTAYANSLVDP